MSADLGRNMPPAPRRYVWLLCSLATLFTAGCALTSKSTPIRPRYFSPERPSEQAKAAQKPAGVASELRLGRISSSSYLDDRVVYRDTEYRLGYYDERLWTESPEEYLRRRLGRVLYEERGLRHVIAGAGPTLEVELIAFEEIRKPNHLARVQLTARLEESRLVRWEETLTVDQPISDSNADDADALAAALGQALGTAVDRVADRVVADLATIPAVLPLPSVVPARDARRP